MRDLAVLGTRLGTRLLNLGRLVGSTLARVAGDLAVARRALVRVVLALACTRRYDLGANGNTLAILANIVEVAIVSTDNLAITHHSKSLSVQGQSSSWPTGSSNLSPT